MECTKDVSGGGQVPVEVTRLQCVEAVWGVSMTCAYVSVVMLRFDDVLGVLMNLGVCR